MMALNAEEAVQFPGPDGILEGLLSCGSGTNRGVLVGLHPHPLYGGSMRNNVVETAVRAGQACDLATLRFNFRGVGGSQGHYDEGVGEQDDIMAALSFLNSRFRPEKRIVAGYSFGACIALACCHRADHGIDDLLLIAPPPFLMQTGLSLDRPEVRKVFVGERDDIAPPADVIACLSAARARELIEVIAGTDHFFFGKEEALEGLLVKSLEGSG
jgi:alpha/beta superfamily hydrolase